MGFDGVELYVDINQTQPQNVKNILADNGLEIFSMTPSNVDLGSSDRLMVCDDNFLPMKLIHHFKLDAPLDFSRI
ncbi:MAG: hypothetical protein F6K34_07055, partial [Okeania sp. SIO4D6]|nr:hypothetical protein [Okeania sp. SIO4D6]